MGSIEEFENLLKSAVGGKRLSQSKMEALTKLALSNMESDSQLISVLYRTHKNLPAASKVPSLYIFDSLARAARSYANKSHADVASTRGNAATFLAKMEVVLDGLVQDMIGTSAPEAKEKTLKVLDIWSKANTFPSTVITRLQGIAQGTTSSGKSSGGGSSTNQPSSSTSSTPVVQAPVIDPRRPLAPAPVPPPPTNLANPTTTTPPITTTDTAAILALLAQAQGAAGTPTTPAGSGVPPVTTGLDPTQLALLHQLAGSLPGHFSGGPTTPLPAVQHGNGSYDHQMMGNSRPSYERSRDSRFDDRSPPPRDPRGGSYRGRGGEDRPYEDRRYPDRRDYQHPTGGRDQDYRGGGGGGGRGRDWRDSPRRRSGSPPPSRRDSYQSTGRGGGPPQPLYRRDTLPSENSLPTNSNLDEFGREKRPGSSPSAEPEETTEHSPMPISPTVEQPLRTGSGGAGGLAAFDLTTFDFTAPESWVKLREAWRVTNGALATDDELMMFVMQATMGGGVAGFGAQPQPMWNAPAPAAATAWNGGVRNQNWNSGPRGGGGGFRGRGGPRGRGGGGGRGNYGGGGGGGYQADAMMMEDSDAIVLGGGSEGDATSNNGRMSPVTPTVPTPTSSGGGKMIRVGDKWKWVKPGELP